MAQKEGKTLYLPLWVTEILTKEAERYGGPGVVAAASIVHFAKSKRREKVSVLKEYRNAEVEEAYKVEDAAGSSGEEHKHKRSRRKDATSG